MKEALEHVVWADAWFDQDQMHDGHVRDEYLVQTVGFVIRETGKVLSLAAEVLPDGEGYRAVTHIPKAVIVTRTPMPIPLAAMGAQGNGGGR